MSEKIQKYSPSGKYESIAYAYALGGLVFIVPLTAWLYGFQASRLPNVVNMVIWGVLIYFAPKFIELILKAGKVRSEKMIFWVSAIIVLTRNVWYNTF